jgi:hypothetical protein
LLLAADAFFFSPAPDTRVPRRTRWLVWAGIAIVLALAIVALSACTVTGGPGGSASSSATTGSILGSSAPGATSATGTPETTTATTAAAGIAEPGALSIPPGSTFTEGGGGPKSYTFREEWRRALIVAKQWRPGAYLVTASGNNVNDDGVPSGWALTFADAIPTDELLVVHVDPWGQVTSKRTFKTAVVMDLLQPGDAKIPFGIMDSDAAVTAARAALSAKYDLSATKNPTIGLSFARDGRGPYWTYYVEVSSPTYLTTRVDALTGEATLGGK